MKRLAVSLKKKGYKIITEPKINVKTSFLKPDIIGFNPKTKLSIILDPSIVATSRNLDLAYRDKVCKYDIPEVREYVKGMFPGYKNLVVAGVVVDWRGAWARDSWRTLGALGFNRGYLETLSFIILKLNHFIWARGRERTDS